VTKLASDDDVAQLTAAFHRKLKNHGEDIRKASRVPTAQRDPVRLKAFKRSRTLVDKAYSACLANQKETDLVKHAL